MLITRFDCSISKAVTENKQHGNKQEKKTTLFFDHFGTFAYDSKITIFAVELGIFICSTYQHYSQAGFSVRMRAADLCLVSTMNLKIAMFWLLNIYLKLKQVDK